ncbi:MAG: hypothetical protein Q8936_21435 [Bacillota bacterium]|nr:hypothetical protein [Bacillota bacterium]
MPTLREIRFYVCYTPSKEIEALLVGKTEEEQNKITVEDYDKNYHHRDFEFRLQTRSIASFYVRCLKGYKNDKCSKINIECVPNIVREPNALFGIYSVQVAFNVDEFFKLDNLGKKKKTLELIKVAISQLIEKEGWDKEIFDEAYNRIVSENYVNKWAWKKQKNNPSRKYIAKVSCEHGIHSFDISIVIMDKNNNIIKEETVVREKPDEWMFGRYFGDLKWISNNEVVLVDKEGNSEFSVNIKE